MISNQLISRIDCLRDRQLCRFQIKASGLKPRSHVLRSHLCRLAVTSLETMFPIWFSLMTVFNHNGKTMNEFLRDMLAVTLGVIIGGLVLMAIYDYYYNVNLASTTVGG